MLYEVITLRRLREMLNVQLPPSMRIQRIEFVADDFHARYSAKRRVYRYIIKEGLGNPFEDNFITFVPSLDREAISDAIGCFVGTHDFDFFKKSGNDLRITSYNVCYTKLLRAGRISEFERELVHLCQERDILKTISVFAENQDDNHCLY